MGLGRSTAAEANVSTLLAVSGRLLPGMGILRKAPGGEAKEAVAEDVSLTDNGKEDFAVENRWLRELDE